MKHNKKDKDEERDSLFVEEPLDRCDALENMNMLPYDESDICDDKGNVGDDSGDDGDIKRYNVYALSKSSSKKMSEDNFDNDMYNNYDYISQLKEPYADDECGGYFNEQLELDACEIIKGTSLDKYTDGRCILLSDIVECFIKLADKYPSDMVYCFNVIAGYGKATRYSVLLNAIPSSYLNRMLKQMSSTAADMIASLRKENSDMVDIFC